MFSLCKQTHPATGVEHAICCNFFNNAERNLVTAGANILKVYRIIPDVEPNNKEKFTGKTDFARKVNEVPYKANVEITCRPQTT